MKLNTYEVRILKTVWGTYIMNEIREITILLDGSETDEDMKRDIMGKISKEVMDIEYNLISSRELFNNH